MRRVFVHTGTGCVFFSPSIYVQTTCQSSHHTVILLRYLVESSTSWSPSLQYLPVVPKLLLWYDAEPVFASCGGGEGVGVSVA